MEIAQRVRSDRVLKRARIYLVRSSRVRDWGYWRRPYVVAAPWEILRALSGAIVAMGIVVCLPTVVIGSPSEKLGALLFFVLFWSVVPAWWWRLASTGIWISPDGVRIRNVLTTTEHDWIDVEEFTIGRRPPLGLQVPGVRFGSSRRRRQTEYRFAPRPLPFGDDTATVVAKLEVERARWTGDRV